MLISVIQITACGATGRTGPIIEECAEKYNSTNVELIMPRSIPDQENMPVIFNSNGVQRWTAPRGEYYTLVVKKYRIITRRNHCVSY